MNNKYNYMKFADPFISYLDILDEAKMKAKYNEMNDESNLRGFIKLLKVYFYKGEKSKEQKVLLRLKAQKSLELLNIMTIRKN